MTDQEKIEMLEKRIEELEKIIQNINIGERKEVIFNTCSPHLVNMNFGPECNLHFQSCSIGAGPAMNRCTFNEVTFTDCRAGAATLYPRKDCRIDFHNCSAENANTYCQDSLNNVEYYEEKIDELNSLLDEAEDRINEINDRIDEVDDRIDETENRIEETED